MAFNVLEDYQRLLNMCETGRMGWWVADFSKRTFTLSEYMRKTLGITQEEISFSEFQKIIHPEHREIISKAFLSLNIRDHFEARFPLLTREGYQWVRSRYGHRTTEPDGTIKAFGIQVFIDEPINSGKDEASQNRINRLLFRLNTISQSLFKFFRKGNTQSGIEEVLEDIRDFFNASRAYIMEFNDDCSIIKATHEHTDSQSGRKTLAEASVGHLPLWNKTILAGKPMIIDNCHTLTDEYYQERQMMIDNNVNSMILIPLTSRNKTWGVLGVDIVDGFKTWSNEDYQWLSSLTNIIGICIKLEKEKKEATHDHHMLLNIFNKLPVGVEIYNRKGLLIDANEKDLELFGVKDKNDMIGINLHVNPNIPINIRNRIYEDETVDFDTCYEFSKTKGYYKSSKTGHTDFTIRVRKRYDQFGNFDGYIFICMDNTEKMKIQKRVSEFENFFVIISNYAKVGYAKYNLINDTGYAIPQWYENLGEKPFTSLFEVVNVYKNMHPEDRGKLQVFFKNAKEGKARDYQAELRISRPEKGWKYIRTYIVVNNYSPESGIVEVTSINYDITELKETETELIDARDRAEASDRLKTAFLANITHEIRTPLNAIVNLSDIITEDDDLDPTTKNLYKSIIKENNEQLLKVITDIIALSNIESSNTSIKKIHVDINATCQKIVNIFKHKVKPNVCLEYIPSQTNCCIETDPKQLEKVLSELTNNAIKFTNQGSIKLGYDIIGNKVRFHVTDTGTGISAEKVNTIFTLFVKLDSFVKGVGIGLPLAKAIVERLGGKIGVESAAGQGSTFWFELPINDDCGKD